MRPGTLENTQRSIETFGSPCVLAISQAVCFGGAEITLFFARGDVHSVVRTDSGNLFSTPQ